MKFNTYTLNNGLQIVHYPSDKDITYCGYIIKAGTRNERDGEEGLAHFCEHASFKGTVRRSSTKIIRTLDDFGGELNAYTNKEHTVYHCAIQHQHINVAIDLLTDMVFNSTYPDAELEKEKAVVCDEIDSYYDSPAELIYDDFENIVFAGHPLGHNILGTKESVRNLTADDVRRFTRRHYRPDNTIFFINGNIKDPVRIVEKAINKIKTTHTAPPPAPPTGGEEILPPAMAFQRPSSPAPTSPTTPTELHPSFGGAGGGSQSPTTPTELHPSFGGDGGGSQSHVMIGGRGYGKSHPHRLALSLLCNILGGPAMSSRLNLSLRERNALVYTVEASSLSYTDTGVWTIYFGCDHHDVSRCRRLVRRELDRLMNKLLTPSQLRQALTQMKGQMALAEDSREGFTQDFAKMFTYFGRDISDDTKHALEALTPEILLNVARDVFAPENVRELIL